MERVRRWAEEEPDVVAVLDDRETLTYQQLAGRASAISARLADAPVNSLVAVLDDAGARFVRLTVRGINRSRDHRLRFVVATGVEQGETWADAAFGPVTRKALVVPDVDRVAETPPPTAPLHRHVSLFTADTGATLFSDGLAEYETRPDGRIAITLLRAVGELSRDDLPERPGHAGWPAPTPAAQSLGAFTARFALLLHDRRTNATIAEIESAADDVLVPEVLVDGAEYAVVRPRTTYDDLIDNNTRRIAILEAMAQAIYREWFVEFSFS